MVKKYKRKEDAYDSACEWLYEKDYEIIIENQKPARAFGFLTGFIKNYKKEIFKLMNVALMQHVNIFNYYFNLHIFYKIYCSITNFIYYRQYK